jgi:tetrahydrodipicolinate N-succinyltransferase
LAYLVLGVIIGAASVMAAGAYSRTDSTTTDASTIAAMIKPAESVCQELVVVKELESPSFAQPVR